MSKKTVFLILCMFFIQSFESFRLLKSTSKNISERALFCIGRRFRNRKERNRYGGRKTGRRRHGGRRHGGRRPGRRGSGRRGSGRRPHKIIHNHYYVTNNHTHLEGKFHKTQVVVVAGSKNVNAGNLKKHRI